MRIMNGFTWEAWLHEMLGFILYPLGEGVMNHFALVLVLVFIMGTVATWASKFGKAESL